MLDLLNHAGPALSFVLQVPTLGILLLGIMLGIVLGALPGFGSSQSMALLFPMTFAMSPEHAILFFIAVYSAAEYGGSVPAILIRTPGTPAQSVTVLDGYAMTRKGLAGKALKISLISGVLGGTGVYLVVRSRNPHLSGSRREFINRFFRPGASPHVAGIGAWLLGCGIHRATDSFGNA